MHIIENICVIAFCEDTVLSMFVLFFPVELTEKMIHIPKSKIQQKLAK